MTVPNGPKQALWFRPHPASLLLHRLWTRSRVLHFLNSLGPKHTPFVRLRSPNTLLPSHTMAGRSGHDSSSMIVTNTPARDLVYTNLGYCSTSDLRKFAVHGSNLGLASLGDSCVLTISYPFLNLVVRFPIDLCGVLDLFEYCNYAHFCLVSVWNSVVWLVCRRS